MKLLIASNNLHKFKELSPSLERLGFQCFTPDQLNIRLPQEVECFDSYKDNARSKVQALLHAPVDAILGDDSGLEVMALGNQPGLHSARYGTGREEDNRTFYCSNCMEFLLKIDKLSLSACYAYGFSINFIF